MEEEESKVKEHMDLMLEQVEGRKDSEVKKVLIEVCCGEESKLASLFKDEGGESTKHDVSKEDTVKALKMTIESLREEEFE